MTLAEKENIKAYIRAVRIEMDKRYSAKFATTNQIAALKGEIDGIDTTDIDTDKFVERENGKGLSEENYTSEEAALLRQLAGDASDGFTAADVLDIFD